MATVSIIVPVYNAENYLERCVDSLVNQTYRDIEIILIDDGSKDNSGVICDRLAESDCRIKVLHCPNGGVSTARNRGIEIASGEFLSFVDSDDWMSVDAYEKALACNSDVVYCDYAEVYGNQIINKDSFRLGDSKEETIRNMICAGPRGGNIFNFILVRRQLLERERLLFPGKFKRGEDFWFTLHCFVYADSISHAGAIYYYDCGVTTSATHTEKISTDKSYLSFLDECIELLKEKGMWNTYETEIGWRILLEKTIWMTNPRYFHLYKGVHPEVNHLVDSCPFLGTGMKCMMKLVDKNMTGLATILSFINRIKNS